MNAFLEDDLVPVVKDPATARQEWADQAACLDLSGLPYFPEDGEAPPTEALECCARCPVAQQCVACALQYEASDGYRYGWWGGCSPSERERIWTRIAPAVDGGLPDLPLSDRATIARALRTRRWTIAAIALEIGCTERSVYRYLSGPAA
jgi:hypothetical protein